MKNLQTPGGKRLRALREMRGKTQLDVELDANLGIGYLQRLELGRVQQPERDTLDRILGALNGRYSERREVLELFGYVIDAPLPLKAEIDWAISVCRREVESAAFPAYLLDCSHRLLYWNQLALKLLAVSDTLAAPTMSQQISMLRMVFDPAHPMMPRIKNPDVFLPAQIRALRYEMQRFRDEAWYGALIEDMLQHIEFERLWEQKRQEAVHIPARPLTQLELEVSDNLLRFRLIAEPFVQDHRFRVIFYLPADTNTNQQCMDWMNDGLLAR